MKTFCKAAWLTLKASRKARMTAGETLKLACYVALAGLAARDGSPTYRMHVGAARGCLSRAMVRGA